LIGRPSHERLCRLRRATRAALNCIDWDWRDMIELLSCG
jgi:hypothetical protein